MKVNVLTKVIGYDKKPVKDGQADLVWKNVFFQALNNFTKDEQPSNELKIRCYQITKKIFDSNDPDLAVDERALVMERVKKMFAPLICGEVEKFLEEPKKELKEEKQ